MPTIRLYEALSSEVITQEFESASFRLHTMTPTSMTYTDGKGASIELDGTGFKYTPFGEVRKGTVTAITLRDRDGNMLETVTHLDPGHPATGSDPADSGDTAADAHSIYSAFKNYGASALAFIFNSDRDHLIGSKAADILDGGARNDVISGGKGNDLLSGEGGTDHLTGGAGHDVFYFAQNSQRDIITDFHASGNERDKIEITEGQWEKIEMHQHKDYLVLDFGFGDQLILDHIHKADIDKSDFTIIM
jgi:Ca2+-binding RTX toxin-like protein